MTPTAASRLVNDTPCQVSSATFQRKLLVWARDIWGKDCPHLDAPQLCPRTMGPPGTPVWCSRGYQHSERFPLPCHLESGQPHLQLILGSCYNGNKNLDWVQVSTSDSGEDAGVHPCIHTCNRDPLTHNHRDGGGPPGPAAVSQKHKKNAAHKKKAALGRALPTWAPDSEKKAALGPALPKWAPDRDRDVRAAPDAGASSSAAKQARIVSTRLAARVCDDSAAPEAGASSSASGVANHAHVVCPRQAAGASNEAVSVSKEAHSVFSFRANGVSYQAVDASNESHGPWCLQPQGGWCCQCGICSIHGSGAWCIHAGSRYIQRATTGKWSVQQHGSPCASPRQSRGQ